MNFEEIQSIWDSQEPVDKDIDWDVVRTWMRSRHRFFERLIGVTEIVMTGTLLFLAATFMKDPLLEGHDRVLMVAGFASLLAAMFVWTGRIARRKRAVRYDDSLLGILQKSLDGIDYQIGRMKNFVWWFACPAGLGLVIGLFIVEDSKRYLFYTLFIPAFVLCMGLAYWQIRREIRTNLIPEKQRLEDLRRRLVDQ